jgi:tRNA(His) guanylyltransferase
VKDTDALGNRIKQIERSFVTVLPRNIDANTYYVYRIDGKAFHTYAKNFEKPFDYRLSNTMNITAEALCKEIQGACLAYTQSDEISVVSSIAPNAELWFGGKIQKLTSITASIATATFNSEINNEGYLAVGKSKIDRLAHFDSRVFSLPNKMEVYNYLLWRYLDCLKNAIAMRAQREFSAKQLNKKHQQDQLNMLTERGINFFSETPLDFQRGRLTRKYNKIIPEITYVNKSTGESKVVNDILRTFWETKPAPDIQIEKDLILSLIG